VTSFTASTERVLIAGPAGTLEVVVNAPDTARRGVALVAHPNPQQGGTLDNKVAQTLAKAFHALDYVAVRFNFRGVGASQGSFDDGDGECEDALAALATRATASGVTFPARSADSRSAPMCRRSSRSASRPSASCSPAPLSSASRSRRSRPIPS
jgi:hypothetical protein